jgi:hypothetical protein
MAVSTGILTNRHHVKRAWSIHDFRAFERATRHEDVLKIALGDEREREGGRWIGSMFVGSKIMPGSYVDGSIS